MAASERSQLPVRVANVIEEGRVGGPQIRIVRVAEALGAEFETVIVMPRRESKAFRELCDAHKVQYRIVNLTRLAKQWQLALSYVLFFPFETLSLARLFRREGIALVHASGGSWQYKAVLAARLAHVPVIWHLNDTMMPGWIRRIFNVVQHFADGFIFASCRSRDYYHQVIGSRPLAIVPATVSPGDFDPEVPVNGDEDLIGRLEGRFVIGTVANINPVKGLECFVRAVANLAGKGLDFQALVVGPVYDSQKAYYKKLQKLVHRHGVDEYIHWVGVRSDIRPLLQRMDVYVCTSIAESSPVSVWEAMMMGRAIVSTDVGDVALYVRNGECGFIVPVDASGLAADCIEQLYFAPAERERMGREARATAIREFSPAFIAKKTREIYERVLASRGNEVKDAHF